MDILLLFSSFALILAAMVGRQTGAPGARGSKGAAAAGPALGGKGASGAPMSAGAPGAKGGSGTKSAGGSFGPGASPAPAPSPGAVSPDADLLARTIWGEASGEGVYGMELVAAVILNRLAAGRWGSSLRQVILAPQQFSVWNTGAGGRITAVNAVTTGDASFRAALTIAERALAGTLQTDAWGADHYMNVDEVLRVRGSLPSWVSSMVQVGRYRNHTFYREAR